MDLKFLLPAIAGAIGVAILMSTVSKTAIRKDGITILKYGIGLKVFAFIAFILSVLLSYVAAQAKADQLFPAIALVLFFYSASIGGLLEFSFVKISYDSEKIYTKSPWKKPREFFWKDIVSLSYSTPFTWHIILMKNGDNIKIHDWINGHEDMVKLVTIKLIDLDNEKKKMGSANESLHRPIN